MKRLSTLILAFIMAGCLILSACGGNGGTSGAASGTGDGGTPAPAGDKTVTIAMAADIMTVDPQVAEDTNSVQVYAQMYSKLVAFDADMNIIPDVATEWGPVSDTAVQFKLRDDVYFHNGEKLTSEDVKFTLDRAVNSSMMSFLMSFLATETDENGNKVAKVETPDAQTVIVHTNEPYSPTISVFADPALSIVNKKAVEEAGDAYEQSPVGSGPFKFVERVTGDRIVLQANPDYYKGAPKVDKLVFRIIPEASQRGIALEKGEVDIAYALLPTDRDLLAGKEGRTVVQSPTLNCTYVTLNMNVEALKSPEVREAMAISIDRAAICETIASKAGSPATNMIAPGVFGFNAAVPAFPYDVAKAKELMKAAGYENGFTINILMSESQLNSEIAQVLQSQWAEIGISLSIEMVESGSFYDKGGNLEFDTVMSSWVTSTADADYTLFALLHSSNSGIPSFRTYQNSQVDKLLEEGRQTFDLDEREKAYAELQQLLYTELPVIPIYYPEQINGYNNRIGGFHALATQFHELYSLEIVG